MKAVGLTRYLPISDPQSLFDTELPTPLPTARDLLVRVEAISVNPVDTKVRAPKEDVEKIRACSAGTPPGWSRPWART